MGVLLELEVKRAFKDWRFIVFTIGMPVVIYLLTTNGSTSSVGGTSVTRYLLVSMAVFSAIGAALNAGGPRISAEREVGWTRQLRLTSMSSTGYIAVKVLTASTVSLAATVALFLVGRLAKGVSMPWSHWIGSGVAIWAGSLVFCTLSILLGYLFNSTSITIGLMVVNLGFSMVGGLFWPTSTFPGWAQVVAQATPTYHLAQLGHSTQLGQAPAVSDVVVLAGYLIVFAVAAAWLYRRDEVRV
ncbi:ABC transporter permease [Kineococcus sp. NPDC059986]|jgi:ABC-2 type transport system permease protein|uniref:ABC transporter permease n=1 Tax=Kineococcus sp. NPDC059986 TaxID=3155538 RepID=UPI00344C7E71